MQFLTIQECTEFNHQLKSNQATPYSAADFYTGDFLYYLTQVFNKDTISSTNLLLKENTNTLPNNSQPRQYRLSP